MPTETHVHGDALCCMIETWARHKPTEAVSNKWLAAVGGWRLAVGGWRLAVGGPWGVSLSKTNWGFEGQPWVDGSWCTSRASCCLPQLAAQRREGSDATRRGERD